MVTVTSTVPDPAGTVAVSWPSESTVNTAVAVPKDTLVLPVNPLPVTVMLPPPASGPELELSEETTGDTT